MPFAAYKRLSWGDGGLRRGPLTNGLEDALQSEEAHDPNFAGVAEGENELELPEIFTPEEFDAKIPSPLVAEIRKYGKEIPIA